MLIYTYKRVVCVCLLVCWFVCFLSATRHLSTLRRCLRVAERAGAVAGDPSRTRASMRTARARARIPYNFSTKKSLRWCLSKASSRTRTHAVVYVTAEIFQKKGIKKTNMPLPKLSLQFAFSWSVYFSNRTESYSSQIVFAGPRGIICNFTFSYLIFKQNYWQEETSYLIFGRSRPWSARIRYIRAVFSCYYHNKTAHTFSVFAFRVLDRNQIVLTNESFENFTKLTTLWVTVKFIVMWHPVLCCRFYYTHNYF